MSSQLTNQAQSLPGVTSSQQQTPDWFRQLLLQALSDPMFNVPKAFETWIIDRVAVSGLNIPLGQIIGYSNQTQASRVNLGLNQTVATGATRHQVQFDTVEFDYGGLWDATNHQFVIKLAGKYIVGAALAWLPNAAGDRFMTIRHNTTEKVADARLPAGGGGDATDHGTSAVLDLAVGDVLDTAAIQSSGGDLDIAASDRTNMWVVRVGP